MSNNEKSIARNRWLIAIMGTLLQMALGTVYAWSFFQQPIMNLGGWSNSQVAWAFSLAILFLGLSAAWGGINLPRYGPRKLAISGGVLFGLSYIIAGVALGAKSLALLYIGYGVIGGIGLGLGYVTPVATVAKWFPDKKGLITGMVVMGFGFGAMVMAKLVAPVLLDFTSGNLVVVFYYIGTIMLLVTSGAGYFLVNPPAGFMNSEIISNGSSTGTKSLETASTKECILSNKFIMMWIIFFCNITAGIMFIGFQSPLLQDLMKKGMSATMITEPVVISNLAGAGATLIALSSVFNGLGRFFWGGLSDRIGRLQTFRIILASQIVVLISLLFVDNPMIFSVLVCYILLCYGGGFGTMPSFVMDVFGNKLMAIVYGAVLTAWGIAGVIGPQIVAALKDWFAAQASTYTFIVAAGLLTVGLLVSLFMNNEKFSNNK